MILHLNVTFPPLTGGCSEGLDASRSFFAILEVIDVKDLKITSKYTIWMLKISTVCSKMCYLCVLRFFYSGASVILNLNAPKPSNQSKDLGGNIVGDLCVLCSSH